MQYKHFFDVGYNNEADTIRHYSYRFPLITGKWRFISDVSNILVSGSETINIDLSFSSNDELFSGITLTNSTMSYSRYLYDVIVFENGAWTDGIYRDIVISDINYLGSEYINVLNTVLFYVPTAGTYIWAEVPRMNFEQEVTYNVDDMEVNVQMYSMTADDTFGDLIPVSFIACARDYDNNYSLTIEGKSADSIIFDQDGWRYHGSGGYYTATDTEKLRTLIIEAGSTPIPFEGTRFCFLWKNLISQDQTFLLSDIWIVSELEIISGDFTGETAVLYTSKNNANIVTLGTKGKQVITDSLDGFSNFCNIFDITQTEEGTIFEASDYPYVIPWGARLSTPDGIDGGTLTQWNVTHELLKELNKDDILIAKYNLETDSASVHNIIDYDPEMGTITADFKIGHNDIFAILSKLENLKEE